MELLQDTILGHWTRENNSYSPPSNMNAVIMKKIVGHKLIMSNPIGLEHDFDLQPLGLYLPVSESRVFYLCLLV